MINVLRDKAFLKRFFQIAFPVMVQAFLTFIVTFIDNVMVSSVSNEAVGGVYAANQATYIFLVTIVGVAAGAGVFMQQFIGAKDEERQRQCFRYKWVAIILFLVIIVPLYYAFGEKLIWFYCHNDAQATVILEQGKSYLDIAILSYIPYGFSVIYAHSLRETGRSKHAMFGGGAALITNVIGNAIFIYGLKMGVRGAALATLIARSVELIVLIIISHRARFAFCLGVYCSFFSMEKELFKRITAKGVLLFFNEVFWAVGMILLSLAYAQRDNVLSALSVVTTMQDVFSVIFQGLSVGIGVLVGGYLGAGNFSEAKEATKKLYWLGLLISLIVGAVMVGCSPFIPLMFTEVNAEQKALATRLIIIYGSMLPAFCISSCTYMTLKTGGKALTTFFLDSGLMWTLFVPLAWLLTRLTSWPLPYVYLAIQSIDIAKSIIGLILVKKDKWLQNLTILEPEVRPYEPQD